MWKKGESEEPVVSRSPDRPQVSGAPTAEPRRGGGPGERAVIGPSIVVTGEIRGEEDLLVQGRVEGTIELAAHSITIGTDGRVQADTHGRIVTIEGEVEGDVRGEEKVVLRPTARVRGTITAPRVALEDGARFQGTIDMDFELKAPKRSVTTSSAARPAAAETAGPTPATGPTGGSKTGAAPSGDPKAEVGAGQG